MAADLDREARVLKKQLPTNEVAAAFLVIRAKLERLQLR